MVGRECVNLCIVTLKKKKPEMFSQVRPFVEYLIVRSSDVVKLPELIHQCKGEKKTSRKSQKLVGAKTAPKRDEPSGGL